MTKMPQALVPPGSCGLTSVVLGVIALMVFFMPVLSIPISMAGVLFGIAGLSLAAHRRSNLLWSVVGVALCCLALAVGAGIQTFTATYQPPASIPASSAAVPGPLATPPPARPPAI